MEQRTRSAGSPTYVADVSPEIEGAEWTAPAWCQRPTAACSAQVGAAVVAVRRMGGNARVDT